jgi:hypothetical protein
LALARTDDEQNGINYEDPSVFHICSVSLCIMWRDYVDMVMNQHIKAQNLHRVVDLRPQKFIYFIFFVIPFYLQSVPVK